MLVSGFSPVELACGRKPPPLLDVEPSNPEQLTTDSLERDRLDTGIARLALKAHNEARQAADLIGDLAQRLKPTDGPFKPGTRAYFWHPQVPLAHTSTSG